MLSISENKRYILKNGEYFPFLADTAWTLLQKLTYEEMVFYLDKRFEQGFNVIQVSALSEDDGIRNPDRYGNLPFVGGDVYKPSLEYFKRIHFLADECHKRGMVLVLLPTWGDKFNLKQGIGPEIFTPENALFYGRFLADFIGDRENIIWMLGGDRPLETQNHFDIIDSMAKGIRSGEHIYHLMTFHPQGEASSADYLKGKSYIDFHSLQSSHSFGGFNSHKMVKKTLETEFKPCIDAECFYEDFPIGFDIGWNYRFNVFDIVQRIYKNMLSGALGHTYGHQSVWCFKEETDGEYLYSWKQALERPMAGLMKNINVLTGSIDIMSLKPSSIAVDTICAVGNGFVLVYVEKNQTVFIDPEGKYTFKSAKWFDPISGLFLNADILPQKNVVLSEFNNDAILIIYY